MASDDRVHGPRGARRPGRRGPWPRAAMASAIAAGAMCVGLVGAGAAGVPGAAVAGEHGGAAAKVVAIKDARIKFEINATDRDGGVQVFLDADQWRRMSILDPGGTEVLRATTSGRLGRQGGTELFMESAEPSFAELPLPALLRRFPEGRYRFRGVGLEGERLVGSARVTHDLPDGPRLVSPLSGDGPQPVDDTTVAWQPVAAPAGSSIIGYQVLVVQPDTGLRALPKVTLDVMMPPTATSMRVPAGFLQPGTAYEWEVLAIEAGGNQTLSSDTFTTVP